MLKDLRDPAKDILARECCMIAQPDLSYAHGADTPRVTSRIISPQKLSYVEGSNVQGVYLDTKVTYNMVVTCGTKDQPTKCGTELRRGQRPRGQQVENCRLRYALQHHRIQGQVAEGQYQ